MIMWMQFNVMPPTKTHTHRFQRTNDDVLFTNYNTSIHIEKNGGLLIMTKQNHDLVDTFVCSLIV